MFCFRTFSSILHAPRVSLVSNARECLTLSIEKCLEEPLVAGGAGEGRERWTSCSLALENSKIETRFDVLTQYALNFLQ